MSKKEIEVENLMNKTHFEFNEKTIQEVIDQEEIDFQKKYFNDVKKNTEVMKDKEENYINQEEEETDIENLITKITKEIFENVDSNDNNIHDIIEKYDQNFSILPKPKLELENFFKNTSVPKKKKSK